MEEGPTAFKKAFENLTSVYKRTLPFLSLVVVVIGFIVFSYVVQEDNCFTYDDWRRPFTLVAFIILAVLSSIGVILYALSVKITSDKYGNLLLRALILVVGGLLVSSLYGPTINLMSKSRTSFEMVDVGATTKNPKQKNWTMVVAGLLIYGSIIPLGKELAGVISGQSLLDSVETENLLRRIRLSPATS